MVYYKISTLERAYFIYVTISILEIIARCSQ